jgi:hypothetical protein
MNRFKPGDIAWYDWGGEAREAVIIVRRAMCKDFSPWDRRNKTSTGITFARHLSQMAWLTLANGKTEIIFDALLFKRQYIPRRAK